eukprot:530510-Rhodomonas_salina.8
MHSNDTLRMSYDRQDESERRESSPEGGNALLSRHAGEAVDDASVARHLAGRDPGVRVLGLDEQLHTLCTTDSTSALVPGDQLHGAFGEKQVRGAKDDHAKQCFTFVLWGITVTCDKLGLSRRSDNTRR